MSIIIGCNASFSRRYERGLRYIHAVGVLSIYRIFDATRDSPVAAAYIEKQIRVFEFREEAHYLLDSVVRGFFFQHPYVSS